MLLSELLSALVVEAEKGSNVARIVRAEDSLLKLLVQEKEGKEKNERFVQDFKTLTDVMIQEMVRHDLSLKFPGIEDGVFGEESDCFTNTAGKSIVVKLGTTPKETADLLEEVLEGNEKAASVLAQALHKDITEPASSHNLPTLDDELPVESVGIWIDPIDSTFQYISGVCGSANSFDLIAEGLQCVTVLIGAFDRRTGRPIAGVCGQPFKELDKTTHIWSQGITWGVSYKEHQVSSIQNSTTAKKGRILLSSSESCDIKKLLSKKFSVHTASGAGYKLLSVAWGKVDAYLLSKPTVYKWDCCGPHGVLQSVGGGLISYEDGVNAVKGRQLTYTFSKEGNGFPGVIAYKTDAVLADILECLNSKS